MAVVVAGAGLLLFAGAAGSAGPAPLRYGVADDYGKYHPCDPAFSDAMRLIGYTDNRMTVVWDERHPGTIQDKAFLDREIPCSQRHGVRVILAIYPAHAGAIGSDEAAASAFAAFAATVAAAYPAVKDFVIGNEPNQPRFWQPQFAGGQAVAGRGYEAVLALTYDAVKAARPNANVIGFAISSRGNDNASASNNVSRSPIWFIHDVAEAYVKSGRKKPIMDEVAFHPYAPRPEARYDTPVDWPNAGAGGLDRIKQALWDGFAGTGQPVPGEQSGGRETQAHGFSDEGLPIMLAEVGTQADVVGHESAYTGSESVTVVASPAQGDYHVTLMEIAACDPDVEALLFFPLVDEPGLGQFQSGNLFADLSRRPSFDAVKAKIAAARGRCQTKQATWRHTQRVIGAGTDNFGARVAGVDRTSWGFTVAAKEDATYNAGIFKAGTSMSNAAQILAPKPAAGKAVLATSGRILAGYRPAVQFPKQPLPAGTYFYGVVMRAVTNPARSSFVSSPAFIVGSGGAGSGAAPSPPTSNGKVTPPASSGQLVVTGLPQVGRVLSASITKLWEPQNGLLIVHQWQRCKATCEAIPGAVGSSYLVRDADEGWTLRALEVAINARGKASRTSAPTQPVTAALSEPTISAAPRIDGNLSVGAVVAGFAGTWGGTKPIALSFQWQRCSFEFLCVDIGGATGLSYRLGGDDKGQRLQLRVVAMNRVAARHAFSAKTDRIAPGREATVRQSYLIAFGREPTRAEIDHWAAGTQTLAALVENHVEFIADNRPIAQEVVDAAYAVVYGHEHSVVQAQQFATDVSRETASPKTYDDLVEEFATDLARQAYRQIFFWDSQLRKHPVAEWVARVRSGAFDGRGMTKGEQLWTAIALSNDPIHGTARTTYHTGASDAANREGCFGAIGPGCKGAIDHPEVVDASNSFYGPFLTRDGRKMKYIRLKTAVGSMVHDPTCRVSVGGAWCELNVGNFVLGETPILKYFKEATEEWNKAVSNTLQGRKWDEIYGPYPSRDIAPLIDGKNANDITYSDDLRPVERQTRYTEVQKGGLVFGLLDFTKPHQWGGIELRSESRLEAPEGTGLDTSDKDYCRSGRFSRKVSDSPHGPYGVCS